MAAPAKPLKILEAAGATGGHLFPALALLKALEKKGPIEALFVATDKEVEKNILSQHGYQVKNIKAKAFKGQGLFRKVMALSQALKATLEVKKIIKEFKPRLCVTSGGYATAPVGIAAWLLGCPLAIHEQNSCPGLTNRFLGKFAKLIMLGFKEAAQKFPQEKIVFTGNPIRESIAQLHQKTKGYENLEEPIIFVTGGSQGAVSLNKIASEALLILKEQGLTFEVIHQSGQTDKEELEKNYKKAGLKFTVAPFFENMAEIYEKSQLIICRGGAGTISEIAAAKLPAIIVPLPWASDNHQAHNAYALVKSEAALSFEQKNLTGEKLASEINGIIKDKIKLKKMSEAMAAGACLDADEKMAETCLSRLL